MLMRNGMMLRFALVVTCAVLIIPAALSLADDTAKSSCAEPAATTVAQVTTDAAKTAKEAAPAATHAYAGTGKCKMCHMPYFKAWSATPHAKAFEALSAEKKENADPKCVKCHVVGFGKGGYAVDKPNVELKGVGCEACHGPGTDYMKMAVMKDPAKAKAAGLVMPTEAVCTGCHNKESPTFKAFDFKKAVTTGVHKVVKETK